MTRGILDTSIFIAKSGRPLDVSSLPDEMAISVITLGELRAGLLAARDVGIRDRRLATYMTATRIAPIPIDEHVAESWARLRILLRDGDLRMGVNDSWIAATAMSLEVPLFTQDSDFHPVEGLEVIAV